MTHVVVISGGTATNNILEAFTPSKDDDTVSYILPVSDNGGSSSEILRVLGGCAIGDIRSRLVRLIPEDGGYKGIRGVKELLGHRLPAGNESEAVAEWRDIVDGSHAIWGDVDESLKVMLRSFLIHVDMEIHKRSKLRFRFEVASVGNLFLTGARLFFGDLDSAIELVRRVCRIEENVNVYGCLNTNFTYHIAAVLESGEVIKGQSQISHPSSRREPDGGAGGDDGNDKEEVRSELNVSQLHFSKDEEDEERLVSRISRVYYISPYGEEIHPRGSERTIESIGASNVIVYSVGSLYTSIIPVLLLRGVGEAIIRDAGKRKVMLMNCKTDRETHGMTWLDHVLAVVRAVEYSLSGTGASVAVHDVVNELVYIDAGDPGSPHPPSSLSCGAALPLQHESIAQLEAHGITCRAVRGVDRRFTGPALRETLFSAPRQGNSPGIGDGRYKNM